MPSIQSFLNNVLGSVVDQSLSTPENQKFGNGHLFEEHDGRMQPMRWQAISLATKLKDNGFNLLSYRFCSTLLRIKKWTSLKFALFRFLTALNQVLIITILPARTSPPAKSGKLMFNGYYVWDRQEMWSDSLAHSCSHSHSSAEITAGTAL